MIPLHHFIITIMLFSGGLSFWLASVAWRRHPERWALPFTTLMLAFAWWSLGSATELSVPNLENKLYWLKVQYVAIPAIPFLLLWFCLVYSNRRHWLRWYVVVPMIIWPMTIMLLMWTGWGNLWRTDVQLDPTAAIPTLYVIHGVWFSAQLGMAYIAILFALALLGIEAWKGTGVRRKQSLIIIGSMLVPTVGNMFVVSGEGNIDITPIFFAITGAGISWGLMRYGLFDVGLTARQLLIDSMADGMIAINNEQRVVDVNTAVTNLLDLPKSEIIGQNLGTLVLKQIALTEAEQQHLARGGELSVERNNETLYYDVRVSRIGTPPQGSLVVLRDVTERKREAQAVEELRETMTRAMVHDLRSPIGVAYTAATFLKEVLEDDLSAEDRRLLDGMELSLTRAITLINEILDISHLESGQMRLNLRPFSLADLAEKSCFEQNVAAEAKQISFETELPQGLPMVQGDYELLARVFQNLINNGLKFTPTGGRIRINAQRENNHVLVTVQDSGTGIPAQIRPYLFQKFAKGSQEEAGSGLGLAFCKMVLEAHNQQIWVADTLAGTGAAFSFTLPLAPAS